MENIRKYFSFIYTTDDEDEMMYSELETIGAVSNKLLLMSEANQKAYCRVILKQINDWIGVDEELQLVINGSKKPDIWEHSILYLSILLNDLFDCFNIDMRQEAKLLGYNEIIPEYLEKAVVKRGTFRHREIRKKFATAKTKEQVDVIRTLLRSAGVEYSSDVNLAQFISWLCGGSADSIRNNGLVPNTGYENEEVLKEKFALIGIKYEKGKIK